MPLPHLYVSGPMSNIAEYNFPLFRVAARDLRAAGYEVTSPHEVGLPCGCTDVARCGVLEHAWSEYLRSDLIAMLGSCTAVATLPDFLLSRGANLEVHIANTLGWPVRPVGAWLSDRVAAG
jgi:hypothetical protein